MIRQLGILQGNIQAANRLEELQIKNAISSSWSSVLRNVVMRHSRCVIFLDQVTRLARSLKLDCIQQVNLTWVKLIHHDITCEAPFIGYLCPQTCVGKELLMPMIAKKEAVYLEWEPCWNLLSKASTQIFHKILIVRHLFNERMKLTVVPVTTKHHDLASIHHREIPRCPYHLKVLAEQPIERWNHSSSQT